MQTNLNLDIRSHAQLHQTLCLPRVYLPCVWYAYYHLIRELIFSVSCEIDVVFRLFSLRIIIRLMQCQPHMLLIGHSGHQVYRLVLPMVPYIHCIFIFSATDSCWILLSLLPSCLLHFYLT